MAIPPPLPTREDPGAEPPLPRPQSHRASYFVSWTAILLCVALVFVGANAPSNLRPAGGAAEDATEKASARELRSAAKLAVGFHALMNAVDERGGRGGARAAANIDAQLRAVDSAAKTPVGKLRAAIVAGHIRGADEAVTRLDALTAPAPATTRAASGPARQPASKLAEDIRTLRAIYRPAPVASSAPATRSTQPNDRTDADARAALVERHGWFGELALAFGKDDSDPHYSASVGGSVRAALATSAFGVIVMLGIAAGLVLLIVAIVLLANGKLRLHFVPTAPVAHDGSRPPVFLEAFALYITLFVAFSLVVTVVASMLSMPKAMWPMLLSSGLLPLAIAWPVRRGATWADSMAGFGWTRGERSPLFEIGCGLVGYIAGLPLLAIAFGIALLLSKLAGASPTHPIVDEFASAGAWRILQIYLLAAVWAPVMEETMFRGALFNHMRRRWGWTISATVVGVIFAAIHPQGWTFIPVLASIGIVLAAIREWRGSIWASMAAHAFSNFTIVTLGLSLLG